MIDTAQVNSGTAQVGSGQLRLGSRSKTKKEILIAVLGFRSCYIMTKTDNRVHVTTAGIKGGGVGFSVAVARMTQAVF